MNNVSICNIFIYERKANEFQIEECERILFESSKFIILSKDEEYYSAHKDSHCENYPDENGSDGLCNSLECDECCEQNNYNWFEDWLSEFSQSQDNWISEFFYEHKIFSQIVTLSMDIQEELTYLIFKEQKPRRFFRIILKQGYFDETFTLNLENLFNFPSYWYTEMKDEIKKRFLQEFGEHVKYLLNVY